MTKAPVRTGSTIVFRVPPSDRETLERARKCLEEVRAALSLPPPSTFLGRPVDGRDHHGTISFDQHLESASDLSQACSQKLK
jgi:hypothetical protein